MAGEGAVAIEEHVRAEEAKGEGSAAQRPGRAARRYAIRRTRNEGDVAVHGPRVTEV